MTRHALVIGAGGAVGEAIARNLADRGWRVTGSTSAGEPSTIVRTWWQAVASAK